MPSAVDFQQTLVAIDESVSRVKTTLLKRKPKTAGAGSARE